MARTSRQHPSLPELIESMFQLSAPAILQAIDVFGPAPGSRGLDAGCGVGCHVELLSHRVGPTGHLTGLDISQENLAWAQEHRTPATEVEWVQGDIRSLPFHDSSFDWVWCSDTLWPGASIDDPTHVVAEFARVVRPGGVIALLYWSSQVLLPGYPGLEARLNAAFVETVPYLTTGSPQLHFLRARGWLDGLGPAGAQSRTFVTDIGPAKDERGRETLGECFHMFWGEMAGRVSSSDWREYLRLCEPESAEFIADAPDYQGFLTYTIFWVQTST